MEQSPVMPILHFANVHAEWRQKVSTPSGRKVNAMKKKYCTPKAIIVDFSYDTNVVAQSITCSGSKYVYLTHQGCNEYKYTDYKQALYSLHPCDWVSTDEEFIT